MKGAILNILRNLRFSLRVLRKSPGLTATVALTLALGIGATTPIYTAVYATLLAPMPYPDPDQLVIVWSQVKGGHNGVSAGDFTDWRAQSRSFVDLKAFTGTSSTWPARKRRRWCQRNTPRPACIKCRAAPL